jgi:hypothetical protein
MSRSARKAKEMTLCELKAFHNKTVSITFHDGEVATARLACSSEDCEDVMVDILGTNRPERYVQLHACSYIVPASELLSVADISDAAANSEATTQNESVRETLHLVETIFELKDVPNSLAA